MPNKSAVPITTQPQHNALLRGLWIARKHTKTTRQRVHVIDIGHARLIRTKQGLDELASRCRNRSWWFSNGVLSYQNEPSPSRPRVSS